ncbi:glycosyltransferase family 2 protein (plasmid) [Nonomuraea sp. CA-143628]|uniref:glycosyltransferase family 2 protein n=1 Tax=Nonomuraea sp. CA-143628 TaxID=3239997 RepID=UPI003D92B589
MTPDGTGSMVVVVPTRGRPGAVAELARAFTETCGEYTKLLLVIDADDPNAGEYRQVVADLEHWGPLTTLITQPSGTMVTALNFGAAHVLATWPDVEAIGMMGDDHRPRTPDWDEAYVDALRSLPGFVYGNDLVQRSSLPTQVAVSTSVIESLGHMAPPTLHHLYVDNYWLTLGRSAGCITYLPHVVVEHLHPVAGTAEWDDGYRRVNAPDMYQRDREAFQAYMREHGPTEVLAVREALARSPR